MRGHVLKAQGLRVRDHATGKALEGADRQTDRRTNRLSAHYSKMQNHIWTSCLMFDKWNTHFDGK